MDLLIPHTGTVIWMLFSFLVVFFILKKFAWKPLLQALKQREESIAKALQSAEVAKREMEKLEADNEKILSKARQERDKILAEARDLKDSITARAKEQAKTEADKIIEDARGLIRAERDVAMKEIKEYAALLSVRMTEKLLKEKLASEKEQKDLIDRMLRDTKMN